MQSIYRYDPYLHKIAFSDLKSCWKVVGIWEYLQYSNSAVIVLQSVNNNYRYGIIHLVCTQNFLLLIYYKVLATMVGLLRNFLS